MTILIRLSSRQELSQDARFRSSSFCNLVSNFKSSLSDGSCGVSFGCASVGCVLSQSKDLIFALDICKRAGEVALRYFNDGVKATTQNMTAHLSPKRIQSASVLIRTAIETQHPGDAILGEEEGATEGIVDGQNSGAKRRWDY